MGSFYINCGVSNHPINNEQCVIFPIVRTPYRVREGICVYEDDIWKPIFFPIYGKCNGYGDLVPQKSHINYRLLRQLNPKLKIDKNFFSHAKTQDYLYEKDPNRHIWNWFILRDVYEQVMKISDKYSGIKEGELVEDAILLYEKYQIVKQKPTTLISPHWEFWEQNSLKSDFGKILHFDQGMRISLKPSDKFEYTIGFKNNLLNLEKTEFVQIATLVIRYEIFREGLNLLRRSILPNNSTGQPDYQEHWALYEMDSFLASRTMEIIEDIH